MSWEVLQGDCIERMAEMEEASVDAVVCDPPYGLEFMGAEWDSAAGFRRSLNPADVDRDDPFGRASRTSPEYKAGKVFERWCERWAVEALRVLKPGGHLLAFGGTRTYHRLACAIEDAGFEIRDSIMWLYGTGFPKSHDVSKALDKMAGAEREDRGPNLRHHGGGTNNVYAQDKWTKENFAQKTRLTAAATPEAEQWEGWGTALKPAHEPIVVARKPLIGTVAENVLEHGTGGINIDACRIGTDTSRGDRYHGKAPGGGDGEILAGPKQEDAWETPTGRWPTNVVLSEESAAELDEQSGERTSGSLEPHHRRNGDRLGVNSFGADPGDAALASAGRSFGGDSGGASRFFYCAKTSRAERNAGLEGFADVAGPDSEYRMKNKNLTRKDRGAAEVQPTKNGHPTVKPINLMRWLVRMVTPPGGRILDPFLGSGSTGCAAVLEGFDFIGIEKDPDYIAIAEARIAFWAQHEGREVEEVLRSQVLSERARRQRDEEGQLSL